MDAASAPEPSVAPQRDSTVEPMQQDTLNAVTAEFDWRNLTIAGLVAALAISTSTAVLMKKKYYLKNTG